MNRAFPLSVVLSLGVVNPGGCQNLDSDSSLIQDFETRVKDYVKLHKQAESALPSLKPTVSPEKIARHEHELAERIRAARPGAVQGDIFTIEIAGEFRRLVSIAMQGSKAAHIHQSLKHAEPVKLALHAGEKYPSHIPLQSTPPTLLMNLPPLPPEVDYRVVDRDLVLRDVKANLIVDFVPNVIP